MGTAMTMGIEVCVHIMSVFVFTVETPLVEQHYKRLKKVHALGNLFTLICLMHLKAVLQTNLANSALLPQHFPAVLFQPYLVASLVAWNNDKLS